jgi:hypothetical protein
LILNGKREKNEWKKTHRFDSTWFQHHIDPILSNGFSCRSESTEKPILAVTDPDLETEAAWQAHYIKWAKIFGIPDPCGYYEGFIRIVAIYIWYIQCSVKHNNKQDLHSTTVQGYAKAVKNLIKLRSFSPPAD